MPDTAIVKKLSEIGDQIKHVQETNDRLQKNYDGLDLENIKTNAEKAAQALEGIQVLKQKIAAAAEYEDRLKDVELSIARSGNVIDFKSEREKLEYKKVMSEYFRKGRPIPDEMNEKICKAQVELELLGMGDPERVKYLQKDLVAASGPAGGYFIIPERSNKISTRIFETSPLRPVCSVVTTTSDTWEMVVDDDEFSSGWVGEVETRAVTDTAEVGLIKIPVHEGYANPKATQKMLDDAGFDIEAWLNGKVARKLGRQENTAFVSGDGSKKAKGFLSYSDWTTAGTYERGAVEQVTATGTAGALDNADDLITLQNTLIEDYQAGASWGMRRATFTSIMQLKDGNDAYLLDPRMLKTGSDKILLGSNVIFMADMPAVAASALPVVYADFMEFYTIVDRLGIRVLRNPYSDPPYVRFYTTKRVGGAVTNFEAGKILEINAS